MRAIEDISEVDRAWLACTIDAEGTISMKHAGTKRKYEGNKTELKDILEML